MKISYCNILGNLFAVYRNNIHYVNVMIKKHNINQVKARRITHSKEDFHNHEDNK